MNMTKRQYLESLVKEMNLDTSHPFTLLFANACAVLEQRDDLRAENARLHDALDKTEKHHDALLTSYVKLEIAYNKLVKTLRKCKCGDFYQEARDLLLELGEDD